jgi:predicted nucleotidyltransferase
MKMDKKPLDELLADLKVGLRGVYGERLKGLYMYGSYARGDQDEESDLDILVVTKLIAMGGRSIGQANLLQICL